MKPLIWRNTQDIESNGYALFDWEKRKTDSYIFMGGKRLPSTDVGNLKYSQDPKEYDLIYTYRYSEEHLKRFDCFLNNGQSPLVNQKVLDIFNKLCPDDIQAFPAKILPEPGSKHTFENHDYWLINIIKLVDAIDEEKSKIKKDSDGDVSFIHSLNTKEITMNDGIVREAKFHSMIYVSPLLVQAFKEAKVTGVEFIEDKDY